MTNLELFEYPLNLFLIIFHSFSDIDLFGHSLSELMIAFEDILSMN